MSKARKPTRTKLTKRLDDLCRDIVRSRDDNRCQRCGKYVEGSDAHTCHVVAKGKGASRRRFDLLNLFLGCFRCHRWWHDNPTESGPWYKAQWPHRDEYLNKYRGGKPAKITDKEMEDLIVEYKQKRQDLELEAMERATEIPK